MGEILLEELMPSNRWMKRSNIPTAPVSRVAAFRGSCSRLVPSPAAGFRRLPEVHQHGYDHDRQEHRGGDEVD